MNCQFLDLHGVLMLTPDVYPDNRGSFVKRYRQDDFVKFVPGVEFVEEAESNSICGVIRGLHYQYPPQSKLVWVSRGTILDVIVDLRKGSKTYGQHISVELSEKNKRSLFIPGGFAHGFSVQSMTATVQYRFDSYYSEEGQFGIRWDDPALSIDWKIHGEPILSLRDRSFPHLSNS